ncbi:MAG: RNA 2',3'-cyclic phosphodiesterase, partial [Candidatus Sumerlaeia bacterium]|nr:RNA 2',3'-cyclic phosphodiesterase [Candidatus Sumerlaeia bacterium]
MTDTQESKSQTSHRLFFAIELSTGVHQNLVDLSSRMEKAVLFTPAKILWAPPENFHLTLYFLGDLERNSAIKLREQTASLLAGFEQFKIDVRRLGMFPSDPKEPPRVLWIGVHNPPPALMELRQRCADALKSSHLPIPDQDFSPHVTLARIKSTKGLGPFRKQIEPHKFFKAGKSLVTHLTLMESITGDGPARYQPWATFPLNPI